MLTRPVAPDRQASSNQLLLASPPPDHIDGPRRDFRYKQSRSSLERARPKASSSSRHLSYTCAQMDGPADSLEVFYSPHETWTEGASSQQTYGGSDQAGAAGWILCPLWQFLRHRAFGKSLLHNHIQEALRTRRRRRLTHAIAHVSSAHGVIERQSGRETQLSSADDCEKVHPEPLAFHVPDDEITRNLHQGY